MTPFVCELNYFMPTQHGSPCWVRRRSIYWNFGHFDFLTDWLLKSLFMTFDKSIGDLPRKGSCYKTHIKLFCCFPWLICMHHKMYYNFVLNSAALQLSIYDFTWLVVWTGHNFTCRESVFPSLQCKLPQVISHVHWFSQVEPVSVWSSPILDCSKRILFITFYMWLN